MAQFHYQAYYHFIVPSTNKEHALWKLKSSLTQGKIKGSELITPSFHSIGVQWKSFATDILVELSKNLSDFMGMKKATPLRVVSKSTRYLLHPLNATSTQLNDYVNLLEIFVDDLRMKKMIMMEMIIETKPILVNLLNGNLCRRRRRNTLTSSAGQFQS